MTTLVLITLGWLSSLQARAEDGSAAELGAAEPGGAEEAAGLAEPPAGPPPQGEDAIDALTNEIAKGLRCPVCQGLSVADSPADGARTMKHRIRELVAMGYDRQQIEDYFVDRYGVWILLAPPEQGRHWLVYLAPVGFMLAGVGGIWFLVRTRAEEELEEGGPGGPPAPTPGGGGDDLDPYRQRVLAELGLSGPGGRA